MTIVLIGSDSSRFASVLKLGQVLHMLGHVCAKNHSHHSLAEHFDVVLRERFQEIELRIE